MTTWSANVIVIFSEQRVADPHPKQRSDLRQSALDLDIARGHFQIAMVVNLAAGIDRSGGFCGELHFFGS